MEKTISTTVSWSVRFLFAIREKGDHRVWRITGQGIRFAMFFNTIVSMVVRVTLIVYGGGRL
jgi:hypothetical protein